MTVRTSLAFLLSALFLCSAHGQPRNATIGGIVLDSLSGEGLIGSAITLRNGSSPQSTLVRVAATDKFGRFSFPGLTNGEYSIQVRRVGYLPRHVPFDSRYRMGDSTLVVRLCRDEIGLEEISVYGERRGTNSGSPGTLELLPSVIQGVPTLGGEPDFLRTLKLTPGVKSTSEISYGLYIRGGAPDQNLNLLDNVTIYEPTHLGGFVSTFSNDIIKQVRLLKSAGPAEYGERLSSVLDVTLKDGSQEKVNVIAGLSTISARLSMEGPLTPEITFLASGRRMYLDLIYPLFTDSSNNPKYHFGDLNGKLTLRLSETDRLLLTGFWSSDVLYQPPGSGEVWFDVGWRNGMGSVRWLHIASPSLFLQTTASWTHYGFDTRLTKGGTPLGFGDFVAMSRIEDFSFKFSGDYFPSSDHILHAGVDATAHRFTLGAEDLGLRGDGKPLTRSDARPLQLNGFIQDECSLSSQVKSNVGFRFSYFSGGQYFRAEPRAGISIELGKGYRIESAATLAHQFIHLILRNDINLPTGIWIPASNALQPGRSVQGSIALERELAAAGILLRAEGYHKKMWNLYEYRDGADLTSGIPLESQLTEGTGESYGLELYIGKRVGALTGWIGYTLSWTRRTFPELNNGRSFYPLHDSRHDLSAVLNLRPSARWEFGATWVYRTGQAYSSPTGYYVEPALPGLPSQGIVLDFATRNGSRLSPFHRLDLLATYKFPLLGAEAEVSASVYNAYNRRNAYAQYISFVPGENLTVTPSLEQISLFSILPSLGLSIRF